MIQADYIGKYVTVKFDFTPRLLVVMQNTVGAQWNKNRQRWELPPNDITIKWFNDFTSVWPGIKLVKSERLISFINKRGSNKAALIAIRTNLDTPVPEVDNRSYKLKPYTHQMRALRFMVKRKQIGVNYAALFYEMGLGKTKIVIDFADIINAKNTLVILPKTLIYSWTKEIKKNCANKKILTIDLTTGSTATKIKVLKKKLSNQLFNVYQKFILLNYDAMRNKALLKTLLSFGYDIIALDESTYIKNYSAQRTKAIMKLKQIETFRILMTGTPLTNDYQDLFAPMKFLSDNILGIPTLTAYKATYMIQGTFHNYKANKNYKKTVGWRNIDDLMEKIKLHSLIATLDEWLDIPKAMPPIVRSIDLGDVKYKKIKEAYNSMRDKFIVDFKSGQVTAPNILTRSLRLQQITSGFLTNSEKELLVIDEPPKIEVLKNVIQELGHKEKVIIGARFHYDIKKIIEALAPIGKIIEISGNVTGKDRSDAIEQFEKDKNTRFLVGTPRTFGYGLTFVKTRYIIWYSSSFSYEERKQTNARIRRAGQKQRVCYIDLICKNTVDELILAALENKRDMLDYVMQCSGNIENLLPRL